MGSWSILAGEYPPKVGGVAAYTRNVAVALAAAGDDVHVWSPSPSGARLVADPGVAVHTLRTTSVREASSSSSENWRGAQARACSSSMCRIRSGCAR
jgi:hypothetical protein